MRNVEANALLPHFVAWEEDSAEVDGYEAIGKDNRPRVDGGVEK